jgi:hypothetical protein
MIVLILVLIFPSAIGCICTADSCATFRDAANPAIELGVVSIATGLINGVFALLQPEGDSFTSIEVTNFTSGSGDDPNTT